MNRMKLETASGRSLSVFHPLAACLFVGGNIIIPPKLTKLQLRLFNNLRFSTEAYEIDHQNPDQNQQIQL